MSLLARWLRACLRASCVDPSQSMLRQPTVVRKRNRRDMDGSGLTEAALTVARATSGFQWPHFDTEAWLQVVLLVVSLIFCALASASETALTSISRIKLK